MTDVGTTTILVVDDAEAVRRLLRWAFVAEGYLVREAGTGVEALDEARRARFDVIVLDLILPELGGLDVCRTLRQEMTTPILMLTARAGRLDVVKGLAVGADDYMTKPFSLRELLARVSALLRRARLPAEGAVLPAHEVGGFRLDRSARTVHVKGNEIHLTPKEFDLLSLLFLHSGRVLTREEILHHVWGDSFVGHRKTVDVHVSWMRQKFEHVGRVPFRISTVLRQGYRLDRLE
ncbi:MAG: response regulator transcription factor [Candidatus Dormibacteria bacterium]